MSDPVAEAVSPAPNFVAIPVDKFNELIAFIRTQVPTGFGMPMMAVLGPGLGIHIPPEQLPGAGQADAPTV